MHLHTCVRMCAHPSRMHTTHMHAAHMHTAHMHTHTCTRVCDLVYTKQRLQAANSNSHFQILHAWFSEGNFVITCASCSGHIRTEGFVSYTSMREKAEASGLRAPSRGQKRGREPRVGLQGPGALALHWPPQTTPLPLRSPPVMVVDQVRGDDGHPEP